MMKKFTQGLVILSLYFSGTASAQFNTVWTANYQHTTSANFSNESRKVVTDASGNSYVLADVTSDIDPAGLPTTSTFHYTVLSKYSPTGILMISRSINVMGHFLSGWDNRGGYGLEIDASGNLYIGYSSYDPTTGFDANLAKYNTGLVRLWNHRYNPTGTDKGIDIAVSSAGDVYAIVASTTGVNTQYNVIKATSQFTTDTAFYSMVVNTDVLNQVIASGNNIYTTGYRVIAGFKNVLSVKIGNNATLKWLKTFNGGSAARDDIGTNLTMGADGFIYITGTSDQGVPTGNDVIIMKVQDSNGQRMWARYKDFNHSLNDAGYFINASDVNYVYAGSVSGNSILLERLETAFGSSGGRVNYVPLPSSSYSAVNGVALTDMKVSPNFGFYLTGNVAATNLSSQAFTAAFLVKYVVHLSARSTFKLDAEMPVEGDFGSNRTASCIAFNFSLNDVCWLRDSYSTYSTHAVEKVVLTDLGVTSGLRAGNSVPASEDISIYPNPSNNFVSITSSENIIKTELFDMTGKNVKTITGTSEKVNIDLSDLNKGIYIGKIFTESGNVNIEKIIKN